MTAHHCPGLIHHNIWGNFTINHKQKQEGIWTIQKARPPIFDVTLSAVRMSSLFAFRTDFAFHHFFALRRPQSSVLQKVKCTPQRQSSRNNVKMALLQIQSLFCFLFQIFLQRHINFLDREWMDMLICLRNMNLLLTITPRCINAAMLRSLLFSVTYYIITVLLCDCPLSLV